jgi:hypothetical protein
MSQKRCEKCGCWRRDHILRESKKSPGVNTGVIDCNTCKSKCGIITATMVELESIEGEQRWEVNR